MNSNFKIAGKVPTEQAYGKITPNSKPHSAKLKNEDSIVQTLIQHLRELNCNSACKGMTFKFNKNQDITSSELEIVVAYRYVQQGSECVSAL